MQLGREQVLAFRVRAQQLDRASGRPADTAVLDLGVQDSGTDGARWALACRGVDQPAESAPESADALVTAWTLRGAPHVYRREDLPQIAAAVAPFSEADAAKRVLSAAQPLAAAGIGVLPALDRVAEAMRQVVQAPMVKGEVSGRLTEVLEPPYLLFCRPCGVTHPYEMLFRLAALRAGLELQPGTSPPVLQPVPGLRPAETVSERFDVVRGCLRLLGPSDPASVARFLDAPTADVRARWPADAAQVTVEGARREVLPEDLARLAAGPVRITRLLAPFDLFLQPRDRGLLVDDPVRARALWPALGRPGAVLVDGALAGLWRPRASGRALRVQVEPWRDLGAVRGEVEEQAARLAASRGLRLAGVDVPG